MALSRRRRALKKLKNLRNKLKKPNETNEPSQTKTMFFTLPLELREMVYEFSIYPNGHDPDVITLVDGLNFLNLLTALPRARRDELARTRFTDDDMLMLHTVAELKGIIVHGGPETVASIARIAFDLDSNSRPYDVASSLPMITQLPGLVRVVIASQYKSCLRRRCEYGEVIVNNLTTKELYEAIEEATGRAVPTLWKGTGRVEGTPSKARSTGYAAASGNGKNDGMEKTLITTSMGRLTWKTTPIDDWITWCAAERGPRSRP
ncbi:hypothetical protein LTR17_026433 [Elasticomyces elasticus]|nr:hypothetical protein LTR17_026433 [Elasticomyces elasticus]